MVGCMIPACGTTNSNSKVSIFKLPQATSESQSIRRSLWISAIEAVHIGLVDASNSDKFQVCGNHFESDQFAKFLKNYDKKLKLKFDAVPSLFPGHPLEERPEFDSIFHGIDCDSNDEDELSQNGTLLRVSHEHDHRKVKNECAVKYCNTSKEKVQFFPFPLEDRDLMDLWLKQIRLRDLTPNKKTRICAKHFSLDQFKLESLHDPRNLPRLAEGAVPTLFTRQALEDEAKTRIAFEHDEDETFSMRRRRFKREAMCVDYYQFKCRQIQRQLLENEEKIGHYESFLSKFLTPGQVDLLGLGQNAFWTQQTKNKCEALCHKIGREGYTFLVEEGWPLPPFSELGVTKKHAVKRKSQQPQPQPSLLKPKSASPSRKKAKKVKAKAKPAPTPTPAPTNAGPQKVILTPCSPPPNSKPVNVIPSGKRQIVLKAVGNPGQPLPPGGKLVLKPVPANMVPKDVILKPLSSATNLKNLKPVSPPAETEAEHGDPLTTDNDKDAEHVINLDQERTGSGDEEDPSYDPRVDIGLMPEVSLEEKDDVIAVEEPIEDDNETNHNISVQEESGDILDDPMEFIESIEPEQQK